MAHDDKLLGTLRRFRKSLDQVLRSNAPKRVHDLRTRSRRLEAAIRALTLEDAPPPRRLLKAAARLRKRAGRVRDMDVLAGFASQLAVPGQEDAVAQLAGHLAARRKKAARSLKDTVSSSMSETKRALKQCRKLLRSDSPESEEHQTKIESAISRLTATLAALPQVGRTNLHDYRIKLKELRYTLELAADSDQDLMNSLAEVTGAIGEWHDWSELHVLAAGLLHDSEQRDLLNAIRSTVDAKLHNALALATDLHKRYFSKAAAHSRRHAATLA